MRVLLLVVVLGVVVLVLVAGVVAAVRVATRKRPDGDGGASVSGSDV